MKNKIFYPLVIVLLLSGTRSLAQSNTPVFNKAAEYTKIVSNSPEAEAMAKYGIIPVTLYSGLPNVSIPIYHVQWGSLSLPISLTYNNNGYKPGEEASRVGLGWCLNAGGVITRVVNGMVDESTDSRRFDSFPNIFDFNVDQEVLESIATGKTDGEPDVYIFNFNGVSGKFIYINDKIYFSSQQDLKISKIGEDFRIITEDGTIYDFTEKEITSSRQLDGGLVPNHTSAWLLSSITSKDKKDIITFSYTAVPYQHSDAITDMYTEKHIGNQTPVTYSYSNSVSASGTTTKELAYIYFGNNRIQFVQDASRRLDMQCLETDKRALKNILIYDNNSTLIKKFNLVTGYFGTNKKLKLCEVQQVDNNDVLLNRHILEYNDGTVTYPDQNTKGIDYWGFYNGASNTSLIANTECNCFLGGNRVPYFPAAQIGMLSRITYPTGGTTSFEYESNYYSNGGVQNIYTPHSATTTTYFNYSNNGGPVTTSLNFNINVGQYVHLNYSRDIPDFPSYGVKFFQPIATILNGTTPIYSFRIKYPYLQESDSLFLPVGSYAMILSCENTAVSTTATVGYKELTNLVSPGTLGPGLRIKTITSNDKISNKNIVKSYSYNNDNGTTSGHLNPYVGSLIAITNLATESGNGYEVTYSSGMRSGLGGILDNEFYYNRVTETTADGNVTGKTTTDFIALMASISSVVPTKEILWKTTSPNNLSKVKETTYNYDVYSTKDVVAAKARLSSNILYGPPIYDNPNLLDMIMRYHLYTFSSTLSSFGYYRLKSETTTTYSDDPGDLNTNTSTKNYYYPNSKYSMPGNVFERNSKGEVLQNNSLFPFNYTSSSPSLTLDQIEETYQNTLYGISQDYANGRSNAITASSEYRIGSYWDNPDFRNSVTNNSSYISAYFTAYQQANTDRNTSLTWYNNTLSDAISQSSDPNSKALLIMQRDHIVNTPVEQMTYKKINNSTFLTAAIKSSFKVTPDNIPVTESIWTTELTTPEDSATFNANRTGYYKKKMELAYDSDLKLVQQKKVNDVPRSYRWDYAKQYPVAEAINAAFGDMAYTSFEGDETGGWNVGSTDRNTSYALTGKRSYNISNGLYAAGEFSTAIPYIISYWSRDGSYTINNIPKTTTGRTINGWTYYEHEMNSNGGVFEFNGNGLIDEVRLYPKGSQMSTFTYSPLVGMTSQNDAKNNITYFNYDPFGRLANITDADRNILKEYTYNYSVNPLVTGLFYNSEMSQTFTKSGCGTGYVGTQVSYTVPAGAYSSTISQADANQKASNDMSANGQNYANINGNCVSSGPSQVNIVFDEGSIGLCTVTIRDAGNNAILFSKLSSKMTPPYSTTIAASSNGYYTVTVVPDPSVLIDGIVNTVIKSVYSTQTWTQVSGNISITLVNSFY